jgi:threonine dehydratase
MPNGIDRAAIQAAHSATALAALLSGAYAPAPGERVGVVVCGGNTTAVDFGLSATA